MLAEGVNTAGEPLAFEFKSPPVKGAETEGPVGLSGDYGFHLLIWLHDPLPNLS